MLVLLFVALWLILRGDLFYVLPCVILFLCFSVLLALRLPCLGKTELIIVLFVGLLDLRLFSFVCFLFLLVSGNAAVCDCGTPWTFLLPFFLDPDPTPEFAKEESEAISEMHDECHISEKNRNYLLVDQPKAGNSISSPKYTKPATRAVPQFLPMAIPRKRYQSLLICTCNLMFKTCRPT